MHSIVYLADSADERVPRDDGPVTLWFDIGASDVVDAPASAALQHLAGLVAVVAVPVVLVTRLTCVTNNAHMQFVEIFPAQGKGKPYTATSMRLSAIWISASRIRLTFTSFSIAYFRACFHVPPRLFYVHV